MRRVGGGGGTSRSRAEPAGAGAAAGTTIEQSVSLGQRGNIALDAHLPRDGAARRVGGDAGLAVARPPWGNMFEFATAARPPWA